MTPRTSTATTLPSTKLIGRPNELYRTSINGRRVQHCQPDELFHGQQRCRREFRATIQCVRDISCFAEPASRLYGGVAETGNSVRCPNRFLNCCANFAIKAQADAACQQSED